MRGSIAALAFFFTACASDGGIDMKTKAFARDALPSYLIARDLPADLVALERAGRITEAEAWLDERIGSGASPHDPLVIERDRLARVRRDYRQTPEQLLDRLREDIPDLAGEDLERWRIAGDLQWVMIDGELRYFRKEPRNLYRVSREARQRRDAASEQHDSAAEADPNARKTARFDLHEHVESLLDSASSGEETFPGAVVIRAKYTLTVDANAVPEGETIRCWIPFPKEYQRQKDARLVAASTENAYVAPNETDHRTVYQELPSAGAEPTRFWIEYEYTTSGYVPRIDPASVQPGFPDAMKQYLADEPPHVHLTPEVRKLAAEIVDGESNPWLAAERIFGWMDANIRYCSEMEYSTFTSITDKVMTDRAGDCGIHVLMFVALCRAAGIPARWQSGWAMRPENENMHDWAEFYVEPYGWLPADPSFGLRNHENDHVRNFYLGRIDAFRLIANTDYAAEFDPPKTHWRSDNIDNQRGEVEWSGGNLYFDQWGWRMDASYDFQ